MSWICKNAAAFAAQTVYRSTKLDQSLYAHYFDIIFFGNNLKINVFLIEFLCISRKQLNGK